MGFWFFMLAIDLLAPAIMLFFGRWSLHGGPREINAVFGYRTAMSMKNADTWAFAHREIGRLWSRWGAVLLVATAAVLLPFNGQGEEIVGTVGCVVCLAQLVPLIGCIFPVEAALRRTFDGNGNRREDGRKTA